MRFAYAKTSEMALGTSSLKRAWLSRGRRQRAQERLAAYGALDRTDEEAQQLSRIRWRPSEASATGPARLRTASGETC